MLAMLEMRIGGAAISDQWWLRRPQEKKLPVWLHPQRMRVHVRSGSPEIEVQSVLAPDASFLRMGSAGVPLIQNIGLRMSGISAADERFMNMVLMEDED